MTWFKRIFLFIASAVIAAGAYYKSKIDGWFLEQRTAVQISQIVEPHLEVFRPEGDGPFKTILMFHGCGGDQEQQRYWAEVFESWGYAAIYVNSYTGRNIDQQRAKQKVCRGQELFGSERAADVLAAINWSNQQTWIDQRNIVLAGWSHGAWSIMDAFALEAQGRQPLGLNGSFEVSVSQVDEVILFYPYCGIASMTGSEGWLAKPNVVVIDVAEDTVVGTRTCDKSLGLIRTSGSRVQHEIFNGVDHAFDAEAINSEIKQAYRTPKEIGLQAIEKAKVVLREFLR